MTNYGRAFVPERFLEDRAYILLIFPDKKPRKTKHATSLNKIKIPFYENPVITETQSPRYANYKLVGRNSDLYSFLGADSRQITITFNFTLQHLQHFLKETPWTSKEYIDQFTPKFEVRKARIEKSYDRAAKQQYSPWDPYSYEDDQSGMSTAFFSDETINQEVINLDAIDSVNRDIDFLQDLYYNQDGIRAPDTINTYEDEFTELQANSYGIDPSKLRGDRSEGILGDSLDFLNSFLEDDPERALRNIKAVFYYYTNLIRATVVGSEVQGLGPPVVRLNFGPLYQDIPCIVSKYDIEIDQMAGYHLKTLLPNRIRVSLDLNEVRVGDFGSHAPEVFGEADDNVPTWESVLRYGTMDPRTEARLTTSKTKEEYRNKKVNERAEYVKKSGLPEGD